MDKENRLKELNKALEKSVLVTAILNLGEPCPEHASHYRTVNNMLQERGFKLQIVELPPKPLTARDVMEHLLKGGVALSEIGLPHKLDCDGNLIYKSKTGQWHGANGSTILDTSMDKSKLLPIGQES